MYKVTGNNLFGQWFTVDSVFTEFQTVCMTSGSNTEMPFDINSADLLQVTWSYNIFKTDKAFFITHTWRSRDGHLTKILFPENYQITGIKNLTLAGNDYKLIFIDRKQLTLWVMNLEAESDVKKLNFNEIPLDNSTKKVKKENIIKKVVTTNNIFVSLTEDGLVYSGIPPSLIDTSHCDGTVCDVQCGYEHCMLLTDTGRVYTWGNGRRLQLGHGDLENLDIPTEVEALAGIKIIKISAGGWHSLALSEFGDLYAWGWNDTGQLGIKYDVKEKESSQPDLKSYALPTIIDIYDENDQQVNLNVKDMACGTRHTAVLLEDNSVWTTGCNKYGQLGLPLIAHEKVFHFKKSYNCDYNMELICGPWTTVLKCKSVS